MAQNIHLHSKREEWEHSEGKTEAQQDRTSNPTALSQMHGASASKGFSYIFLCVLLFHICSYRSMAGILQLWYFNLEQVTLHFPK